MATPTTTAERAGFAPRDAASFAVVVALWGSSFLLIDIGVDHLTPPVVAGGRLAAGVLTLALVPAARRRLPREAWPMTALLGVCWMAAPFLLFSTAQQWIDSSLAGMLNAAAPLFTAVVAAVVARRLPGRRRRAGLVIGFGGVVLMSLPSLQDTRATALGVGLAVAATAFYGLAFNLVVPLQRRYGTLPVLLRAELCASLVIAPYAVVGAAGSRPAVSSIAAVVALGVLGTGVAFIAFVDLAGRVGATRASLTTYLLPVVAAVLGIAFRGDRVSVPLLLGGVLTIAGAYVASRTDVVLVRLPDRRVPVDPTGVRRSDVRRYFVATVVSRAGTRLGSLAIPLVAVVALEASAAEVGVLGVASTVAFLVVGLPAGVWLDRVRRRAVMVTADLVRAGLLSSIPVAWVLDRLTMAQLWVVVLAAGVATVFGDVGSQSYLPHLVGRPGLGRANAQLATVESVGSIAGPAAGGVLVHLIGAPLVVAVQAGAHVWSAFWLVRLRRPEPPLPPTARRRLRVDVVEGLRFVIDQPILRAVGAAGALTNVALAMTLTMLPLVLVRELGRTEADLGLFLAVGGVGGVLGAATSRAVARRLGDGRSLVVLGLLIGPAVALVPQIGAGVPLWLANAGWAVVAYKVGYDNALLITFRQAITPDLLLGRVNATLRVVLTGAVSLGALVAGILGQTLGPRAALWVAAVITSLVWVPIQASPLRHARTLLASDPEPVPEAVG